MGVDASPFCLCLCVGRCDGRELTTQKFGVGGKVVRGWLVASHGISRHGMCFYCPLV